MEAGDLEPIALAKLARFLRAGGARVELTPQLRLRIGDDEVRPPASVLQNTPARLRWLDGIAAEHLATPLRIAARQRLSADRGSLRVALERGDVVVADASGRRVAVVRATHAALADGRRIDGNFLGPGDHWAALSDALDADTHDDDAEASGTVATAGLHRRFPADTDPEWLAEAIAASRRLRLDRTRVFAYEMRVDVGSDSLRLSPLTATPLAVPFVLERRGERVDGALRLTIADLPMPCEIARATDPDTLAYAWTLVLTVYADLACAPATVPDPPQRPPSRPGARTSAPRPSRTSQRGRAGDRRPRARPAARGSEPGPLPASFQPRGRTARLLDSLVAGHIRQLPPGSTHSDDAARNAAEVGIKLRAGETWVRPHARGLPADTQLHFAWRAPDWVLEAAEQLRCRTPLPLRGGRRAFS